MTMTNFIGKIVVKNTLILSNTFFSSLNYLCLTCTTCNNNYDFQLTSSGRPIGLGCYIL